MERQQEMTKDTIELRQNFKDIDFSDLSKLSEEDFQRHWMQECFRWHDRLLTGEKCHYCPDWDYLPIDETCEEIEACTCDWNK